MRYITRLPIAVIVFILILFLTKKRRFGNKKYALIAIGATVSMLIAYFLSCIPFENYILTFETPVKVFNYEYIGARDAKVVAEGGQSALVVGKTGSTKVMIVPKENGKWILGDFQKTKIIGKAGDGYTLMVLNYSGTDDYYINISGASDLPLTVSDSIGTVFNKLIHSSGLFFDYYACIINPDSDYKLSIGDDIISIGTGS